MSSQGAYAEPSRRHSSRPPRHTRSGPSATPSRSVETGSMGSLLHDPSRRRWARFRLALVAVVIGAFGLAVTFRAYDLQVRRGAALAEMAEEQAQRDLTLSPKRGTIFDRNGAELAVSVDVDSVWANPLELARAGLSPNDVALRLSGPLGLDTAMIAARLSRATKRFVWLKRRVSPQESAFVHSLKLRGIGTSKESRRYYPNRDLAAHVLGFADVDGAGIEGAELAFDARLRGSSHSVSAIRDARGNVVYSERLLDATASQGDDVVLTIDKSIQHIAEEELASAVATFEAKSASIVVMDPSTGEILALANYPSFNPNSPTSGDAASRRNRAVTDRFEPGSTLKSFTFAGALSSGALRLSDVINCENGSYRIGTDVIHDTHPSDLLSPFEAFARSSNIGTAKIAEKMGKAGLFRALRRFGFGESTELGLPGETAGSLSHYRDWYDLDAATISFGQGMSVTTLQLAVATGALANGGTLMKPTLIRQVLGPLGDTVLLGAPEERRQVVAAGVARTMSRMLASAAADGGTGVEASIEGYTVAGKTGTAQKANPSGRGYNAEKWVSSFVGFVPAERPRLVIAVVVDEPLIAHLGGTVAAPVFRRVATFALRHLGVAPEGSGTLLATVKARSAAATPAAPAAVAAPLLQAGAGETHVPSLDGLSARRALVLLRRAELVPQVVGSGRVVSQVPPAGTLVAKGSAVELMLESAPLVPRANAASGTQAALSSSPVGLVAP